jgi:hypothetical protein
MNSVINFKVEQLNNGVYRYKYARQLPLDIASIIGEKYIQVYLGQSLPTAIRECEFLTETHDTAFKILRSKRSNDESKDFAFALLKSASRHNTGDNHYHLGKKAD